MKRRMGRLHLSRIMCPRLRQSNRLIDRDTYTSLDTERHKDIPIDKYTDTDAETQIEVHRRSGSDAHRYTHRRLDI